MSSVATQCLNFTTKRPQFLHELGDAQLWSDLTSVHTTRGNAFVLVCDQNDLLVDIFLVISLSL